MQASPPSDCGRGLSTFAVCAPGLLELGYSPLPRIVRDNHGQPAVKGWSDLCERLPTEHELRQWSSIAAADIALACGFGGLIAIDVDTEVPEVLDAVTRALPHCTVARHGSKGFALLCRHADGPQRAANIYSADAARKSPLVEIMGTGRNITIPPSQHAKTEQPYYWIDPTSGNSPDGDWILPPLNELPLITNEDLKRLREALAPWSRNPKLPLPIADEPAPVLNFATEKRYRAYAMAGLERATAEIATLKEGRPSELFRSVCALGWSVATGVVGEAEFTAAYVNACRDNGLLARDGRRAIEASIRSGLEKAANDPLPHLEDRGLDKRPQAAETKEPDSRPDSLQHIVASMPDLEEDVEQLARLKILDYDRVRKTEAHRLRVSVSALDDAVKRKRASLVSSLEPGAYLGEALEPWLAPVDGSQLLFALIEALRAHVILPEHAYLPVALWILHAHAHGASAISPILAIISPERRCGKTTLLSLLQELTPKDLLAANITAAAVYRAIEMWRPTLLVARSASELSALDIINDLCDADESHWCDYSAGKRMTEKAFANLLKPFGITSKMRTSGSSKGKKFWRKADFNDAWKRYLPTNGPTSADRSSTSSTPLKNKEKVSLQSSTAVEHRDNEKINKINEVEGVERQNPNFPVFAEGMPALRGKGAFRVDANVEAEMLI